MTRLHLLFLLAWFSYVFSQADDKNLCLSADSCNKCLTNGGQCYWCTDENFQSTLARRQRCNYKSTLEAQGCKSFGMGTGTIGKPGDEDFGPTTQVRPQKVSLKLRPDEIQSLRISVKPAKDYPVDLYYLMDMSKSMEDDLESLRKLGTKIATSIETITKNYRLAFGTFVDKAVSPFVADEDPNFSPCNLKDGVTSCVPTFGFKHIFDFNKDAKEFEKAVGEQRISGNLDTPEGGFDGLMQVAVCDSELGWSAKDRARKIIVFVTDASPHIAGDGKIGGIITPNDGACHLEKDGTAHIYKSTKLLDYPSVSQLKYKLKENKVIPIFAVTQDVTTVYKQIADEWKGDLGALIGTLKGDSGNIVELIEQNYNEIATTVQLTDNSGSNIDVTYRAQQTDCGNRKCCKNVKADNICTDVQIEEEVEFEVSVVANSKNCEKDADKNQQFTITVPGFGDTEVSVEMICDCDCEKQNRVDNSPKCSQNGTYVCASCECNAGRYGETCQCGGEEQKDQSKCKHNNETEKVCSGYGSCVCGKCVCNTRENPLEVIEGPFCECNNFGCPRHKNLICGGEQRGECKCGECKCKYGYWGDNCGEVNCTIGQDKCRKDGVLCSGKGLCDCDKCTCDPGYDGAYCQTCVSCPGKCANHIDCVLCQAFNEGSKEVCQNCSYNVVVVNKTLEQCVVQRGDCFVIYSFEQNDVTNNETIYVQREKRCIVVVKKDPDIIAIVLGTIGGIVFLGLILLLLWKLIVTAYDNYEYHKFEKDRMKSKWENDENPLYRPSKQKFDNPVYAGNK